MKTLYIRGALNLALKKIKSEELSINQRPMAEKAGAMNVAVWGETRIDECIEVLTLFFILRLRSPQILIYVKLLGSYNG